MAEQFKRLNGVGIIGRRAAVLVVAAMAWGLAGGKVSAQAPAITFKSAPVKAGAKDAPVMGATPTLGVGSNALEVSVKDGMGMAIANADVSVVFSMAAMPSMGMSAMRNEVPLKAAGGGVYRATTQVTMGGKWSIAVVVKQAGKDIGKRELSIVAK